jgi:hypothetical protein
MGNKQKSYQNKSNEYLQHSCYDKCPTWLKYKLNYVYICFWVLFPYKPVFKDEFYPKSVSLHIKVRFHIMDLIHGGANL